MKTPELLAPAGGMSQLKTALRYGADAVYLGLSSFGLRAAAANFSLDEVREAVRLCHGQSRRLYVTLNAYPWDEEFPSLLEAGGALAAMGVDAAIVADPGVVLALREACPDLPLHLSTQAHTVNSYSCRLWHQLGVSRIILARELSLERIKALRRNLPDSLSLETFVHGAMCYACSGRCLLSTALTGRSANQGRCSQPCRWPWKLVCPQKTEESLDCAVDERGSYVLSAYDLCMIRHLPALQEAGVSSFKIEGRMKNDYYVAAVVAAYREAMEKPERTEALEASLAKVSHRPMNTGFFFGAPVPGGGAEGPSQTMECIGYVEKVTEGQALVRLKNRFFAGDPIEALTPCGCIPFTVEWMEVAGERVGSHGIPEALVTIPVPPGITEGDILRGLTRNHLKPAQA